MMCRSSLRLFESVLILDMTYSILLPLYTSSSSPSSDHLSSTRCLLSLIPPGLSYSDLTPPLL